MPAKSKVASPSNPDTAKQKSAHRQFPNHSLEDALILPTTIVDANAGKPMKRLLLADAIGRTPNSSAFKMLLSSANKYGLIDGNEKSDVIALTPLSTRIVKPLSDDERLTAIRNAALSPELLKRIFHHFDQNKLPQNQLLYNSLERNFGVPVEHTQELAELIMGNGRFAKLLKDISGSPYVMIEGGDSGDSPEFVGEEDSSQEEATASPQKDEIRLDPKVNEFPATQPVKTKPKKIFVAHGKSHQSMEQLQKILNEFKIPHVVAMNEANAGRPISKKIAEVMESCSAAIFVFTKDEEFTNKDGEQVWRPSENLVYELSVASYLYGNKIILLKEEGIKFASDFQDLGYITFKSGELVAKSVELFRELIAFNFISVQVD